MIVACGMEDDGANSIDEHYTSHKLRCDLEGMIPMSEFNYIGMIVVQNPQIGNKGMKYEY